MNHKRSTFRRTRGTHHAETRVSKNRGSGQGYKRAIVREQAAEAHRKALYGW